MKSVVKVRALDLEVKVDLSEHLDMIQETVLDKWQGILDLARQLYKVPAALIMRLHEQEIEVFCKSNNEDNPYHLNETCHLGLGLYCETVIGKNATLEVANATLSKIWQDNPDVDLNMIHYLGMPLVWPDGTFFGTICILDDKTRTYTSDQLKLFSTFKETIEKDLELVKKNISLNQTLEEIKVNHSKIVDHEKKQITNQLISSITHEISTPLGVALTTVSYMDYAIKKSKDIPKENLSEGASLVQKNLEQASHMLMSFKQMAQEETESGLKEINISNYMKSIVMSMKYKLKKYSVNTHYDIEEDLHVVINPGYLSQVVINLINNSVLHAFKNKNDRRLKISAYHDKDHLIVRIDDNGNGMTEDQIKDIYKPFVRFDSESDGSGLGLTIVKEIVEEKMKGQISCCSNESGTCFELLLPVEVVYEKH